MRITITRPMLVAFAAVALLGRAAAAQASSPVGFLPGLGEFPSDWYTPAGQLASSFNISPFFPSVQTDQSIETQELALGTLSSSTVLIGHSAGGTLARYYAQLGHPLSGLITLGTPNAGAPIVETFPTFCDAVAGTVFDFLTFINSLDDMSDNWILDELEPDYDFAAQVIETACDQLAVTLTPIGTPPGREMAPDSHFMSTLNSQAAIAAETQSVPNEVSVVVTTDNYYHGGWIKAMLEEDSGPPDSWATILDDVGTGMIGISDELAAEYPDDLHYMDVSNHLLSLGEDILFLDEAWCESVSGTLFLCYPSDETVPGWSQALGRGTTILASGSVHTQEIQNSPALLPSAFDAVGLPRK